MTKDATATPAGRERAQESPLSGRHDEIQARLDAATPGPWLTHEMGGKVWVGNRADGRRHGLWEIVYATDDLTDYTAEAAARYRSDAELIAHAPADLAALLAEVKRLTAERDHLFRERDRCVDLIAADLEEIKVERDKARVERDWLMRDAFAAYEASGADTDGDKQWHCSPEWAGSSLIDAVTTLKRDYDELLDESESAEAERDEARAALTALRGDVEALADEGGRSNRHWNGYAVVKVADLATVLANHPTTKEAE